MIKYLKHFFGINIKPKAVSENDEMGDLEVLSGDGKLRHHNGTSNSPIVTEAHSATLTNKTIDADLNTISNIEDADIKAGAAIDASKIANGLVSNTEFQYLDGVTSSIQDQLDDKADDATFTAHTGASSGVHGVTGSVVGTTDTQTLSNKTLSNPLVNGYTEFDEIATPATPGANKNRLYFKSDGNLYKINDLGVEEEVGAGGGGGTSFSDADFEVYDNVDNTKIAKLEVSGITTGTTRTLTLPDANTTIVGTDASQVLTNKDIDGGTASNTSRLTLPKNTKTNLDALTRKEGTLVYASDEDKLYVDDGSTLTEVGSGGGGGYADVAIAALDIDWSLGTTFYKSISANSTFTFSNLEAGKTITVVLTNATGSDYTVDFPTTKQEHFIEPTVYANTDSVFIFTRVNGVTYSSSFSGVE